MNKLATGIEKARGKIAVAALKVLPDTCTVYAVSHSPNTSGERVRTETPSQLLVPCSYEALSTRERVIGGAVAGAATHTLKFPFGTSTAAVTAKNKVVVDARGTTPALAFEITGRLEDSMGIFLRAAAILK